MEFADLAQLHYGSLEAEGIEDALRKLLSFFIKLSQSGLSFEALLQAGLKREDLATTNVGRGIAIPHIKVQGLPRLVVICAVSHAGIPWPGATPQDVHVIILVLSPADSPGKFIQALSTVSRALCNDQLLLQLRRARDSSGIKSVLDSYASERI